MKHWSNVCLRGLTLAAILAGICGCSRTASRVSQVGIDNIKLTELKRGEYEIIKTVEGQGEVINVLGLNYLGIIFGDSQFGYVSKFDAPAIVVLNQQPDAVAAATYDAMSKVPDCDMVLPLSTVTTRSGIPFIIRFERATIKGKALKIKCDAELAKTGDGAPGATIAAPAAAAAPAAR